MDKIGVQNARFPVFGKPRILGDYVLGKMAENQLL